MSLPDKVLLCAIEYSVQEHEGAIVFSETIPMWWQKNKIVFTRHDLCWWVELHGMGNNGCMVSHIEKAMRLVEAEYGPNHYPKK